MRLGGIEAGGTKFIVGVGDENGKILIKHTIPTLDPQSTIQAVIRFFQENPVEALGLASFGPIELDQHSPQYGTITSTPKPHWNNTPILPLIKAVLDLPIGFDTDVNAAVLGESVWGNAQGLENVIYLTIGTGIGGGMMVEGKLVHGLQHPEMGHILLQAHQHETFGGVCPYHQHCFEGLASGVSIEARWGKKAAELPFDHPAWEMEADYIAKALMTLVLVASPNRIILGGGVMHQTQLLPMIRSKLKSHLNGYIMKQEILSDNEDFIQLPGLGDDAGLCGAFALAKQALDKSNK